MMMMTMTLVGRFELTLYSSSSSSSTIHESTPYIYDDGVSASWNSFFFYLKGAAFKSINREWYKVSVVCVQLNSELISIFVFFKQLLYYRV